MKHLDRYAQLVVRTGLNVQKGQTVMITGSVELAEFVRMCTKEAYLAGAREVIVNWKDELSDRLYYEMADEEVFDQPWDFKMKMYNDYAAKDTAFLVILSEDPDNLSGVDPKRIARRRKAEAEPLKPWRSRLMSNRSAWCLVSMPTKAWAVKVYPELSEEAAMEKLGEAILKATRADLEDPVAAWEAHQKMLDQKLSVLNAAQFVAFKYKNPLGTDLTVGMPRNHVWFGGGDTHLEKGYRFVANMPTEEVFSMPRRDGVDGRVVASYPLVYNGVKIEDMWFEFKEGLVVEYGASSNLETLKMLLETDEGARRLGEIALVPDDSPISNQNILFYETLFDENAACHFALGEAYPICVKGGEDMTPEELIEAGANVSDVHVDFMVGTADLSIIGIKEDGAEVVIFDQGNFVI